MEDNEVTIRNWIRLFFSTLFLGGFVTAILGIIVRWNEFAPLFSNMEIGRIISTFVWFIFVGFTFSVISQMGFFAYLTVHQFGLRMFRSLWNPVQLLVIAIVLFDLIYFRFKAFAGEEESLLPYIILAIFIFVVGIVVAFFKNKQAKQNTFVSALFFMVVVTVLEWLPVLQVNASKWLYLMLFALLACNAYQLLMLPKYNARSVKDKGNGKTSVN
ncbi:KinB-signaling pathway activation protein [Bacillus pakistanensis]|uniref:KinB-signaling pathway activation protein n=1 Tax=Rossellomorea pakistanensis TaxID=992288 RepID=UPI001EF7E419|nr:KinB-signaling pathway activation protein [Bacillus pakistanensis]